MQSNARNSDPVRMKTSWAKSGGESKPVRKSHPRRIPYKVGYSWNKGGRLKELRIRHLARKFLKIWMHKTFGRVLPFEAKSHHVSVVLRRAFTGWRDEWWTSRREWSLTVRAGCHHRYYLCNWTFLRWKKFVTLQKERKAKVQKAQSFADKRLMRLVWDRWRVSTKMRKMKNRVLESALEQKRLSTMHSVWNLWQTRLQQCQELCVLENQTLKQRALTLQRRALLQWREMHRAACSEKEKESKAALHFHRRLKIRTLHQWMIYVSCQQTKRNSIAMVQHACHFRLKRNCWSKWVNALNSKWIKEARLEAGAQLAKQCIQRRVLLRWRFYVAKRREKAEKNMTAMNHFHHYLLGAGLLGLSLNVSLNKAHRLDNNMAVQHCQQTMTRKYWNQWRDRLEEAEDQSYKPLAEMALTNYRVILQRRCFHLWREKHAEQKHMQDLERRADSWFVDHKLPRCFESWREFTQQRKLQEERKLKAEVFNKQQKFSRVFYTWWERSETRKEEMLSEQRAILHEERGHMQRAWTCWRQRTQQQIDEAEKQDASQRLYQHRLLQKTMMQWKDNSTELRDRRNREQQACYQGDLRLMRSAVEKWKKFVQIQQMRIKQLKVIQHDHEVKLLKQSFVAWKKHNHQKSRIYDHVEDLYRKQTQSFLGNVVSVWRENAAQQTDIRIAEHQAQKHHEHSLQLKVFLTWREATAQVVSKRHQQEEALCRAQMCQNQVRLLRFFRHWRQQAREARRERMRMEKARQHYRSKLLLRTVRAWDKFHYQYQRNKVMKRQGNLLLRLKMYQTYFEEWKVKLQHRRREKKQTERALWHWSLTLQARVLYGWRLRVMEERGRREEAAKAAQVYRDKLLREGVTCILTYAAHMNDLTTTLTQYSQEQRSQHLQRVVRRCAMKWKQRALGKPQREQRDRGGQPRKKSVTFSLPATSSVSSSVSSEQESEGLLKNIILNQRGITSTDASSEPRLSTLVSTSETPNQELLLPPSAFMTTGTQNTEFVISSSGGAPFIQFDPHHSPTYPEIPMRVFSEETEVCHTGAADSQSSLTRELLNIQLDMKSFQQSRKQLKDWRKLKEVLQSWLQTSGKDDQMEKNTVWNELKELEERIHRLSAELQNQKPTMLLHAERIQYLQSLIHT